MKHASIISVLMLCPTAAWADDGEPANPLFRQLIERGVAIDHGKMFKLPEPSLIEGVTGAEQRQIIERLVSKKYAFDQFVRKSPVAPFLLDMRSAEQGSGRDGLEGHPTKGTAEEPGRVQQLDLWFVAYGSAQMVSDKELMSQLFAGERSSRSRSEPLTGDDLKKRDLHVRDTNDLKESYSRIELPLLEKVQVSGIVHAETARGDGLAVAAVLLDPALADDHEYPSSWRPIVRSQSGEPELGEPRPYAGLGGYCRVTDLKEPAGAMFVECHLVFNEPHGWFNGTNLLRSKLPLVVQDSVRTFRRKLAQAK